ncbi:putative D,D-dipeptide-binding periplasmic protein DdpA [bioreactor metagenome]|uniref:Putative D,D-dipeptide-binding periplasmic protein DdpA n=1 Tax=bioreactor metagenome TaxID=1076179 RepID=A0A644WC00_9ZZZZ
MKRLKQSNAYADVAIVQSVEATDDFTVVFTLNEPDASFLDKLTSSAYSILDSELLKRHGGSDNGGDTARVWLDTSSAGSGPFVVRSWSPKELVLEKNPTYWGGNVNIDTVILKKMESVEAELEAIEKGEIDIALDLGVQAAGELDGRENVSVVSGTSVLLAFLAMSRDSGLAPEMSNPKVQEAVRYALDYKGYLALAGENSTVPLNFMPLGFTGALTRDLKTEGRNVEKAKELMAEAGYPAGFTVALVCPDIAMEGIDWNMVALKVKDNLTEIGIAVNIETLEYPQFYEKVRSAALPFYLAYWSPHYYDANSQLAFLPGVGENGTIYGRRTGWAADADNQSLLDLAAKIRGETDEALRAKYSKELQREYDRDNPFAFLFQPSGFFAYRNDTLAAVAYSDLSKKIELRELKAK